jgi:hypothetical protein
MASMPKAGARDPRQFTILVISDPEFLPRLEALLGSVVRHVPDARVHACLVNVTNAGDVTRLRAIHPRITITHHYELLNDTEVQIGLDGLTRFTEKAGYCVNLRARALQSLLKDGHDYVLFMDADCIVRRELSGLLDLMDGCDIVIHKRDSAPDFMRVCAALIGVRRTAASIDFIGRLARRVDEIGNRLFFSDQLAFHQVASSGDSAAVITHLPSTFIDWEFRPNSHIWTGKGQRKFENMVYREEEARYRSQIKESNQCHT